MRNADFRNGHYDTGFVDRLMNSETFELRPSYGRLTRLSGRAVTCDWRVAGSTRILDLGYVEPGRARSGRGRIDSRRRRSHSASREKAESSGAHLPGGKAAPPNERRGRPLDYQRSSGNRPRCWRSKACISARTISRSPPRAKSWNAIAGSGNRPIAWPRRLPRWRKAPTTSASARSSPRRPSPNISRSGLDDIRRVHELVQLPIFCIGGIKLDNLPAVLAAGARRVVIVSGLLQSGDVAAAMRAAKELLVENHKSEIQK